MSSSSRGVIAGTLGVAFVAGLVGGFVGGWLRSTINGSSSGSSGGGTHAAAVCDATHVSTEVLPSLVMISVKSGTSGGTGSGSVIDDQGHILTNNHVIELAASGGAITVNLSRGKSHVPAKIVGRDPLTDIAVIQLAGETTSLSPIAIAKSADVAVGQPVVALGSPLGLTDTVTTGVVSALNRYVNVGSARNPSVLIGAIQTDTAINPGNSGGPLVNCSGAQIGVNSAGASPSDNGGGSVGLNFAIPIDFAMSEANQIIETGRVTHPAIGIVGYSVTDEMASATGLPRGVYIESTLSGGPATVAGLKPGDVITAVNGEHVSTLDEYLVAIRKSSVGEAVKISYSRAGSSKDIDVRVVDGSNLLAAAA